MSISKVMVATDLTERAERAINRAYQLKRETGAAIILLHVIKPDLPPEIATRSQNDADRFLKNRLRLLTHLSPSADAHAVLVGDKFLTITHEALRQHADLILIGEPGKYRYYDFFVGTTAERVIRFSTQPVLVVKRTGQEPYQRVLIAFDGSEGAVRVMKTAISIAPSAEFRVVHAWWPPTGSVTDMEARQDALKQEHARIKAVIEQTVLQVLASLRSQEVKVNIDMIENNPYMAIGDALGWPDLLAIGTHARGRLAVSTVGKLARHVLTEAPCDVLVAGP